MSNCVALLGEVGQLTQQAALGVAAVCGTGPVPADAAPVPATIAPPAATPDGKTAPSRPRNASLAPPPRHLSFDQADRPQLVGPVDASRKLSKLEQAVLQQSVNAAPAHPAAALQQPNVQQSPVAGNGPAYIFFDTPVDSRPAAAIAGPSGAEPPSSLARTIQQQGGSPMPGIRFAAAGDGAPQGNPMQDMIGSEPSGAQDAVHAGAGTYGPPGALLSRGGLTLTGGYSSVEGLSIGGSIERRNIGGKPREASARARYSKIRTLAEIAYADRNFLGSKGVFVASVFSNRLSAKGFGNDFRSTPFRQTAKGINFNFHQKLEDGLSATANYRLSDDMFAMRKKAQPCDPTVFGSPICGALGDTTTSLLSIALTLDRRAKKEDDALQAFRLRFAQDLGVGGSAPFVRTRMGGETHIGIAEGLRFSFDAEAGIIAPLGKDQIPLFDRFYIGDTSLRGFDLRGIGPKVRPSAAAPGQTVAIGGRVYYSARAELATQIGGPLGARGIEPSVFVDAGSVFGVRSLTLLPGESLLGNSSRPRVALGVGLALNTPAGKLRLDFAKPVMKQPGDRTKSFSITFGAAL